MGKSNRHIIQRAPAGVKVQHIISQRKKNCGYIVSNHACRPAICDAWKQPVEIAGIKRGISAPSNNCGAVQFRQYDDAALNLRIAQCGSNSAQGNLPLIFIAMRARREQNRRAFAAIDADHGHWNPAIGRRSG